MVWQGRYKYMYIHGYDSQLFDLEADPEEWNNLTGIPEYHDLETQPKTRMFEQFDPDAIDHAVTVSVNKRTLIDNAMKVTGTRWDIEPRFDPSRGITDQYLVSKGMAIIPR